MAKAGLGCEPISAECFIYNDDETCRCRPRAVDSLNKRSIGVNTGLAAWIEDTSPKVWDHLGKIYAAAPRRFGFRSSSSCAMRIKLLASTAAPTSISNLSRPLARHRFIPRPRNQTEI